MTQTAILASKVPFPDVDVRMLDYAIWNSPRLEHLEVVYVRDKKTKQTAEAQFCAEEYSFYIGDGCIHAYEVQWRQKFPESVLERAANNYLALLTELDAHAATLAELQAAREEVERLRSALRPFANCALRWSGKERHDAADTFLWSPNNKEGAISVKHVLDARQALDSQPDTAGGGE